MHTSTAQGGNTGRFTITLTLIIHTYTPPPPPPTHTHTPTHVNTHTHIRWGDRHGCEKDSECTFQIKSNLQSQPNANICNTHTHTHTHTHTTHTHTHTHIYLHTQASYTHTHTYKHQSQIFRVSPLNTAFVKKKAHKPTTCWYHQQFCLIYQYQIKHKYLSIKRVQQPIKQLFITLLCTRYNYCCCCERPRRLVSTLLIQS